MILIGALKNQSGRARGQMKRREFMKILPAVALMMLLYVTTGLTASSPRAIHQACGGVLSLDDGYYALKPHAGAGLWCDAYIPDELVHKVLKACAVGRQCNIKGSVRGHGAFFWTHISAVSSPR